MSNLKKVTGLENLNTDYVTNVGSMFNSCTGLKSIDMSKFKAPKTTTTAYMFNHCRSLESLDLSSLGITSSTNTKRMFYDCSGLKELTVPESYSNLASDACEGVGSASSPCKLSSGPGYIVWKGGYFQLFAMGDVNHDNYVDVTDVMLMVNFCLNIPVSPFYKENAFMNDDDYIDVTDVMILVNVILSSKSNGVPANSRTLLNDAMRLSGNGDRVTLHLDAAENFTAGELTLTLPEGCTLKSARMDDGRRDGHQVSVRRISDDTYRLLFHSNNGSELRPGSTPLLHLSLEGLHHGDVRLSDILLTNRYYESVVLPDVEGVATGIDELAADDADMPTYNMQGMKVETPRRGVYIRNGKKVVVKK